MIKISLYKKELKVSFENKNYLLFNKIKDTIKKLNFTWNPTSKIWSGPAYKHDELIEALCDLDQIEDNINKDTLEEAISGEPEIEFEKVRRIPDYSLMNFPCMKGKAPNENFQDDGIKKGINRSRYLYAFDMGLGKSYICACILAHRIYKYKDASKCLIVTTSIGVRNLNHELKKFIKDFNEDDLEIADKNNRDVFRKDGKKIILMSYNTFRLVCEFYKKKLNIKTQKPRKPFLPIKEWLGSGEGILFLDECHEISNPSQKSFYMLLHTEAFKYRYFFSGTPFEKFEKIYNVLTALDPWLTYNLNLQSWKDKVAYIGTRFSKYAVREWKREEIEKQNNRFLKMHGNYFSAKDVIDLPDYFEKPIYIPMSKVHREIYQQVIIKDFQDKINKAATIQSFINSFPYQMIAADNPFLLEKHLDKFDGDLQNLIKNFKESYLSKLDAIDDIIESHPDEKFLIWCIHPLTIELTAKRLKNLNPICIDGSVKDEERNKLVDEFKNNPDSKVLIANIQTLNTSITITEAHIQIFEELTFNYSIYAQASRRCYRIGQDKPVISYVLLYDNSLNVLEWQNVRSKGKVLEGLASKNFISQEEWQQIYNCSEDTNFEKF